MSDLDAFEKWARFYEQAAATGTELMWPSETLVRLFRGSYIPGLPRELSGRRVLDVGCGNGNNLPFLAGTGLQVSATEVDAELGRRVQARLARLGHAVDIRVGTNRQLPFETNTFDFLVSWNVVHYEDNEADMRAALREYARVLKPGGRFFISTTGPEHLILRDSERVGPHRYRIGRRGDPRVGQIFYYFDDEASLRAHLAADFTEVLVGRTHDHLMTETLDWFVVTGLKP
jgi:SAM-dependent methyltransferase